MQNSLPSGSADDPCLVGALPDIDAPRAHRLGPHDLRGLIFRPQMTMWRRSFTVFASGTRQNTRSGETPSAGLPSGGSRTTSSFSSKVIRQPSSSAHHAAREAGSVESMQMDCQRRATPVGLALLSRGVGHGRFEEPVDDSLGVSKVDAVEFQSFIPCGGARDDADLGRLQVELFGDRRDDRVVRPVASGRGADPSFKASPWRPTTWVRFAPGCTWTASTAPSSVGVSSG